MSTKTKLRTIPLPAGLAPLPKGSVYLGEIPEQPHTFTGFLYQSPRHGWKQRSALRGGGGHYASPHDSAIAREILGVKEEPKEKPFRSDALNRRGEQKPKKKAAKKAPALRELPKNVKPGTKVVSFMERPFDAAQDNSAVGLLNEAAATIGARAAERDVDSERSMAKCVAAFNVMFGKDITEEQGWLFMVLLKMSRSTVGKKRDDYMDGAAYCALAGEAANAQTDAR